MQNFDTPSAKFIRKAEMQGLIQKEWTASPGMSSIRHAAVEPPVTGRVAVRWQRQMNHINPTVLIDPMALPSQK